MRIRIYTIYRFDIDGVTVPKTKRKENPSMTDTDAYGYRTYQPG